MAKTFAGLIDCSVPDNLTTFPSEYYRVRTNNLAVWQAKVDVARFFTNAPFKTV
jgi:hypothetical protein